MQIEELCSVVKLIYDVKIYQMKNNAELQKNVQDAIRWEPLLNAAEIGVTVKDGVVTLAGVVDSYIKKTEAEDAAKNVVGVKAVVEKLEVKFHNSWDKKDDNEIAREIVNAFTWNWQIPEDKIKIKVEKGWVTLEGDLQWNYQSRAAKDAIKNLLGVVGVSNNIKIRSDEDATEQLDIVNAIGLHWSLYDTDINVKVSGHKATLTGSVHSGYQKTEAARIAFNAPGIWNVDNELVIDYDFALIS